MTSVIWSLTSGGAAVESFNHGSKANGELTIVKEVFVRHDGDSAITNAGFFVRQFSGNYAGSATASADFTELLDWGDDSTEAGFGGVQLNMDAINSYPTAGWSTYDDKDPTYGFTVRTGQGDSESNAITVSKNTYNTSGTDGQIEAGSTPNVRFKMRVQIPEDEDTLGIRQFEVMLAYTATS